MLRHALPAVMCLIVAACSSDEGSGAAGSGGTGGAPASDAGSDALDCDPHQSPASGGGGGGGGNASGAEAGTIILDSGNIDLDSGSDLPAGYLKCYDPNTGAGFVCEASGKVCCEKKDNCWDPAKDPTFCDRPWCPND